MHVKVGVKAYFNIYYIENKQGERKSSPIFLGGLKCFFQLIKQIQMVAML